MKVIKILFGDDGKSNCATRTIITCCKMLAEFDSPWGILMNIEFGVIVVCRIGNKLCKG